MTANQTNPIRKYFVRYPDGMTSEAGIALLKQARDDLALPLTLAKGADGTTIEGEPWHVVSVSLALPFFQINEIE